MSEAQWKVFEDQVADLLTLIGYEVTRNCEVQSAQTDVLAISPRRFKPNLLVECKYHEDTSRRVTIDEIENFTARVIRLRNEGIVDQGYLVANTGFTSRARGSVFDSIASRFVFLYTLDQLQHRLLDTDLYLQEYVRDYERSNAASRFVDLWTIDAASSRGLQFTARPNRELPPVLAATVGSENPELLPLIPVIMTSAELQEMHATWRGKKSDA
jgi:hypothetical protein